jgi:hypothetical protein
MPKNSVTLGVMPPCFQTFLNELSQISHDVSQWTFANGERPTLTHPAGEHLAGPLVLTQENGELTLEIGSKYHCHFDGCSSVDSPEDRMDHAAQQAADFVDRLLSDRIAIAVHYDNRRCIGASLIDVEEQGLRPETLADSNVGLYGGLIHTERFLWSRRVGSQTG